MSEKQLELILGNARRLILDAELLVAHRRYPSAFALAVLGVEEIGKALLKFWETRGPLPTSKGTAHIRKQTAVASLLVGGLIVRTFPHGPDLATLDTTALTEAFNKSDEGQAFAAIRNRELDERKKNALYQDDDILTAVEEDFAEEHVRAVFEIAYEAQQASTNDIAHRAARELYCQTCARSSA